MKILLIILVLLVGVFRPVAWGQTHLFSCADSAKTAMRTRITLAQQDLSSWSSARESTAQDLASQLFKAISANPRLLRAILNYRETSSGVEDAREQIRELLLPVMTSVAEKSKLATPGNCSVFHEPDQQVEVEAQKTLFAITCPAQTKDDGLGIALIFAPDENGKHHLRVEYHYAPDDESVFSLNVDSHYMLGTEIQFTDSQSEARDLPALGYLRFPEALKDETGKVISNQRLRIEFGIGGETDKSQLESYLRRFSEAACSSNGWQPSRWLRH